MWHFAVYIYARFIQKQSMLIIYNIVGRMPYQYKHQNLVSWPRYWPGCFQGCAHALPCPAAKVVPVIF
jgi:hypothetical protein